MVRVNDPVALASSVLYIELLTPLAVALQLPLFARLLVFLSQVFVGWKAITSLTVGDTFQDYGVGSGVYAVSIFTALHFLFLTDVLNDGTKHSHDKKPAKDLPFGERFLWVLSARVSIRGVGWNIQAPHIPVAPLRSRSSFVFHSLLQVVKYAVIVDLAGLYITSNPIFSSHASQSLPITSQGLPFQILNVLAWWANLYAGLQLPYNLVAAIAVALGLWEPQSWPPMFGKFHDAYTLRRMWGRVWHQILRRFVTSIGKSVSRGFGFQSGTNLSSYTQLIVGFFVSGWVHGLADRMIDIQPGRSVIFFQIQAFAIIFEDAVIALGGKLGISQKRWLGWAWVATWLVYTTPLLTSVITDAGRPLSATLPVSPLAALARTLGVDELISSSIPWPSVG